MFEIYLQCRVFLNCHVAIFTLVWPSIVLEAPTLAFSEPSWFCALMVRHGTWETSHLPSPDRTEPSLQMFLHTLSVLCPSPSAHQPPSSSKHWFPSCIVSSHLYEWSHTIQTELDLHWFKLNVSLVLQWWQNNAVSRNWTFVVENYLNLGPEFFPTFVIEFPD